MVQKYLSPVRVYKYPFELVMAAYQKRFPTCKMIPVFLGSDVTYEHTSDDSALHVTIRRCKLNIDAPYLLKKFCGVEFVYFIQKNTLDRRSRTLEIEAHNETFSSRVIIKEHCYYSVHQDNADWTCFEQDASLEIKSLFGFENTAEKIIMKQYTQNIKKGKEIIEYYVHEILSEGGEAQLQRWIEPPKLKADNSVEDTPSQDSGLRSRSDSINSKISQASLVLGATASTVYLETSPIIKITDSKSLPKAGLSGHQQKASKLEDQYIERFLGQLNPIQESRLVQLRQWLRETHKGKIPKDSHILRFMRARDFSVEKSREMIVHSLAWRKLHNIDRLLETYTPHKVIEGHYAGGWHFCNKSGCPLYILKLGQMDVKGLIKSAGPEGVLKHVLFTIEEGLRKLEEATRVSGHPVSAFSVVVDLEGLSMRHLWRPGIRTLLRVIETVEANYPETMGQLLIVRAPRVFPVLWTLVSPFIDENTRRKFMIYGGNDYNRILCQFIDAQNIPDFLGGDRYCDVPEGGLVPKSMYMRGEELCDSPDEPSLCPESVYHTVHVVKDYPHEVLVQIPQKGSVITWDFDILKGDMTFTVFLCRRAMSQHDMHVHHISGTVAPSNSVQYIDKTMAVGVDLSIVEAPHICRDGDSVQGSHVTFESGCYLLQWKIFDSARSSHSFDFPLLTHKSKVMYYTEVLKSSDFKGSMSSLQSCHSGFSSLSVGTSSLSTQSIAGSSASRYLNMR